MPSTTLDEIVTQAKRLPAEQRPAFLRRACADPGIRRRAIELILPPVSHPEWWGDAESERRPRGAAFSPTPGACLDGYRMIRTLGSGGMSEVMLAVSIHRAPQQRAAIKFVRDPHASRQLHGRLKSERRILAALDHPNIAKLLGEGSTPDGVPYIVMEYIDGEPIDAYCDERKLRVEERLRLFRTVCSAVDHMHQKQIIHRDLKPSNILVTANGTPKVLDFGIAKHLDPRRTDQTSVLTQAGVRMMTPDYASPEQVRSEPVTAAADIYALGVLLYELLSGRRPFELPGARLRDIERMICEAAPPALDEALPKHGERIISICDQRSTTPALLQASLRDLDALMQKALMKEPAQRYSSAAAFAARIESFLGDKPRSAREPALPDRTRSFVARSKWILAATATLGVLALAVVVLSN